LNKQVVLERLQEMKENLAILEKLKRISHDEFVKTPEMYKLAERCLQISIVYFGHFALSYCPKGPASSRGERGYSNAGKTRRFAR